MPSPPAIFSPLLRFFFKRGYVLIPLLKIAMVFAPLLVRGVMSNEGKAVKRGGKLLGDDDETGVSYYTGKSSPFTTNNREEWRRANNVLREFFSPARLALINEQFGELWRQRVQSWNTDRPVRIYPQFNLHSIEGLVRLVFGFDNPDQKPEDMERIVQAAEAVFKEMSLRLPASIFSQKLADRYTKGARERLYAAVDEMIAKAKLNPGNDLISMLIKAQAADPELTDKQIRSVLVGLLVAGFDSTSAVLSRITQKLAGKRQLYKQFRREVRDTLQGRMPTYAELMDPDFLPELRAFLVEMIDMHPAFPWFFMSANTDVELVDNVVIPEGYEIIINLYDMARWLHKEGVPHERNITLRSAYIPFGTGGRHCIAWTLAWLMMFQAVIVIMQTFDRLSLPFLSWILRTHYAMTQSAGNHGALWASA